MRAFEGDIDGGGSPDEPFLAVIAHQVVVYDRELLAKATNAEAEELSMAEAIQRAMLMTGRDGPRQELHGIEHIADHAFYGPHADQLAKHWASGTRSRPSQRRPRPTT